MDTPLPRSEPARPTPSRGDLRAVREAARRLTPVVLDAGPGQPRFETYMSEVRGGGRSGWLHLSPVAADALPPAGRVVLRCSAPETPLALSAPCIERVAPDEARIPLADARVWTLPPRRNARRRLDAHEPLTLVVPGGLQDADVDVLPIADLGADWLMIDAGFAIEPGRTLDTVEILGPHGMLRRAAATVTECQPWYASDGSARFRCRLTLSRATASPRGYDIIDSPGRVRSLLELATLLGAQVTYRDPAGATRASLQMEPAGEAELAFTAEPSLAFGPGTRLSVSFELFSISYEMTVRVLRSDSPRLVTSLPLLLRRRRRRREGRAAVPAGRPIEVELYNPASNASVRRAVLDVSFGGLCFEAEHDEDILWQDLALAGLRLHDGSTVVDLGEARVCGVRTIADGRMLCHVGFASPRLSEDVALRDLLEELRHPRLVAHSGEDFDDLVEMYREAGLFAPFIDRNLSAEREAIESNWARAHTRGDDLCRTLARREDDRYVASMTTLQAWDGTWLGQHMAALPDRKWKSPGALLMAYIDHVLLRPDCRFMVFFARESSERMIAIHDTFSQLTGTSEVFDQTAVDYWIRPGGRRLGTCPAPDDGSTVRRLSRVMEPVVARAARRELGGLPAQALCMVPGAFDIPSAARAFGAASLERNRSCRLVASGNVPRIAVMHERTSPGLNLTCMLSASWLVPIHADEASWQSAVSEVVRRPSPFESGDRFVVTPERQGTSALRDQGFERLASVRMYALSRTGLRRYAFYLSDSAAEIALRRILREGETAAAQQASVA